MYQGGVDNPPKFYFMNELKEVVMEEDVVKERSQQKPGGVVCSTEDCDEVAAIYCTEGCEFQCHQCVVKHNKFKGTKSHKVIGVNEYSEFIKRTEPPYPPWRRHKHQLMDVYCLHIFPHKARFSRGRRPRPCWISVKTIYWSGDFQERFFLFDPSLTSGMSAALMQGHCLRRRPCIKQHMSGGRQLRRKYHSSHHISPDTIRYMRQGWINVGPMSQTVGQH